MRGPYARAGVVVALALTLAGCAAGAPQTVPTTVVTVTAPPPSPSHSPAPTRTPTWESLFADIERSVPRIAATTCGGAKSGTGFLVGPDLLATALHVVADTTSLSVRFGMDVLRGEVVAVDAENDLALVRLSDEPAARPLTVASAPAAVGERIAVLGYPLGQPLGMTQGAVTSTDLRLDVGGADRLGVLRTDAVIEHGNSGGPVVNLEGEVVGVADAVIEIKLDDQRGVPLPGENYAVGQPALAALVSRAGAPAPATPTEPACTESSSAPWLDGVVDVTVSADSPDAPSVAAVLGAYGYYLNRGKYTVAWRFMTPSMQQHDGSQEEFAEGQRSSYWLSLDVRSVGVVDDVTDRAQVVLRTLQESEYSYDGTQECSDWHITYTLTLAFGDWKVDSAVLTDGALPTKCDVPYPDSAGG